MTKRASGKVRCAPPSPNQASMNSARAATSECGWLPTAHVCNERIQRPQGYFCTPHYHDHRDGPGVSSGLLHDKALRTWSSEPQHQALHPRHPVARKSLQPTHRTAQMFAFHRASKALVHRPDIAEHVFVFITGEFEMRGSKCSRNQSEMGGDSRVTSFAITQTEHGTAP